MTALTEPEWETLHDPHVLVNFLIEEINQSPPNVITGDASQVGRWLDHFKLIYPDTYEYMILGIASKV